MRSNFGHIKQVADGKYRVYWSEGHNRRSKVIYGSVEDCELFLARRKIEGGAQVPAGVTYRDYWELSVVPTFELLEQRTVYDYGRIWQAELLPRIGAHKVSETSWRYVQTVLAMISAPSVQRHAYRTWKKVCNLAVRDGLLMSNPVCNIRLKPEQPRQKAIMDKDEVLALMQAATAYKHAYLLALEIGCGLRHEEACAITKADIQDAGQLAIVSVSKALTVAGGKVVMKDTKTAFSRRLVACGEPFRSYLLAHMADIPDSTAQQSSPVTISRNWLKYCQRNGLQHIPFGQMRTQFSVMHQQAGSVDSLVALAMGHSDGTTRGRHYTQNTLPAMKLLADNLTAWLQPAEDVARFGE